ncbi:helix-turn-helix transcriptional regulator [bacterium]|nr:helix-turn-helix transcriptional regulator [bacterium]
MDLGLSQVEAAKRLRVNEGTVVKWERGYLKPAPRHIPRLIAFLGYSPFLEGDTLSEELKEGDEPDKPCDLNG